MRRLAALLTLFAMPAQASSLWMACSLTDAKAVEIVYQFAIVQDRESTLAEVRIKRDGSTLIHGPIAKSYWTTAERGKKFVITNSRDPGLQIVTESHPTGLNNDVSTSPAVLIKSGKEIAKGLCGIRAKTVSAD
jgi:hypothetical protein